jgi:tryptophanyl-tRNA synthetase
VVPEALIPKESARIYDLQEPTAKMSKSANSESGLVKLMDDPAVTAKKFRSAVTDTGREVRYDPAHKPGISNLLDILAATTGRSIPELEAEYDGRGYGDFKKDVAEAVGERLTPIRARTLELLEDPAELDRLLAIGADKAGERAERMLRTVYDRVGFIRRA